MKNYTIILNKTFPRDKLPYDYNVATNFHELISAERKIHLVKSNYAIWAKSVREINDGRAVLSLRYVEGLEPKKDSKQIEFLRFSGIAVGIERLVYTHPNRVLVGNVEVDIEILAQNEGLNVERFVALYKHTSGFPAALIHLSPFRYGDCNYLILKERLKELRVKIIPKMQPNSAEYKETEKQISYMVGRLKEIEKYMDID